MPPKAVTDPNTAASSGAVSKVRKKRKTTKRLTAPPKKGSKNTRAEGSSSEFSGTGQGTKQAASVPSSTNAPGRRRGDRVGAAAALRSASTSTTTSDSSQDRNLSKSGPPQRVVPAQSSERKRHAPSSSSSTSADSESSSARAAQVGELLRMTEGDPSSSSSSSSSSGDAGSSSSEDRAIQEATATLREAAGRMELPDHRKTGLEQRAKAPSPPQRGPSRKASPVPGTQAAQLPRRRTDMGSPSAAPPRRTNTDRPCTSPPPVPRREGYTQKQAFRERASSPSAPLGGGSIFLLRTSRQVAPDPANAVRETASDADDIPVPLPFAEFDPNGNNNPKQKFREEWFSDMTITVLKDRAALSAEKKEPGDPPTLEERQLLCRQHNRKAPTRPRSEKVPWQQFDPDIDAMYSMKGFAKVGTLVLREEAEKAATTRKKDDPPTEAELRYWARRSNNAKHRAKETAKYKERRAMAKPTDTEAAAIRERRKDAAREKKNKTARDQYKHIDPKKRKEKNERRKINKQAWWDKKSPAEQEEWKEQARIQRKNRIEEEKGRETESGKKPHQDRPSDQEARPT